MPELEVKVRKAELTETVKTNRDKHLAEYNAALIEYNKTIKKALKKALDKVKAGGKVEPHFLSKFPVPTSYVNSYDQVLDALNWEVEDEITLSRNDFQRYVRNEWEWSGQFAASTTIYNQR